MKIVEQEGTVVAVMSAAEFSAIAGVLYRSASRTLAEVSAECARVGSDAPHLQWRCVQGLVLDLVDHREGRRG